MVRASPVHGLIEMWIYCSIKCICPPLHEGVVGDCVTNTFADNPHEEKEHEAWSMRWIFKHPPPLTTATATTSLQHKKWFLEKGLEKGIGCENQAWMKSSLPESDTHCFSAGTFHFKSRFKRKLILPTVIGSVSDSLDLFLLSTCAAGFCVQTQMEFWRDLLSRFTLREPNSFGQN